MKLKPLLVPWITAAVIIDFVVSGLLLGVAMGHNPQERFVGLSEGIHWKECLNFYLDCAAFWTVPALALGIFGIPVYRLGLWIQKQARIKGDSSL